MSIFSILSKGLPRCSALSSARSYASASFSISQSPPAQPALTSADNLNVVHPYFVPRNSKGSLPVYSDIRNGGSRYLVLVKNVRGNVNALRDDLASSLFEQGSEEAARLKASVLRSDTLVLAGGRCKHRVMDWLRLKGF